MEGSGHSPVHHMDRKPYATGILSRGIRADHVRTHMRTTRLQENASSCHPEACYSRRGRVGVGRSKPPSSPPRIYYSEWNWCSKPMHSKQITSLGRSLQHARAWPIKVRRIIQTSTIQHEEECHRTDNISIREHVCALNASFMHSSIIYTCVLERLTS